MSDVVIGAIIGGLASVICNLVANSRTMAIIQTKLEALTEEVRKHNNFAQRIPVIEEKISVANHRIEDLEKKN